MNITVRLYKLHDYDLIYLYKNLRFPIKDVMYEALKAYVKGDAVRIKFPIESLKDEDEIPKIKNAQFHLILDDVKDWEIVAYLKKLKDFYRNSFLKNVLRYYMYGCPLYVYEKEPELIDEEQRVKAFNTKELTVIEKPLMKKYKKKKKLKLTKDQLKLMKNIGAVNGEENIEIIKEK